MNNFSLKNLSKESVIGLLVALVSLINAVLVIIGKNPLDISDDTIYQLVSAVFMIGSTIFVAYKNNDVTIEGKQGSEKTKRLKADKNKVGSENGGDTDVEHEEIEVVESEVE